MNALQRGRATLAIILVIFTMTVMGVAFLFHQEIEFFFKQDLSPWLQANPWVQWVFSGLGVAIIGAIVKGLYGLWKSSPSTSRASVVRGVESRKGGILAKNTDGQGAIVEDSEAEQYDVAIVTPPGNASPKNLTPGSDPGGVGGAYLYGSQTGRDIIAISIPQAQVETLIRVSTEALRTTHEAQVNTLSSQLGVTQDALTSFLQILREQNVPLEKLPDTLATIAQRFREMQERLAVLNPEDLATKALIEKARKELNAGHYDQADALLSQAETAEQAAACRAEQLARDARSAADRRWLNAAAARAERGESSIVLSNYQEAAAHFQAATEMTPASAPTARGIYRRRWADVLQNYGDQQGDNAVLAQAIALYRQALTDLPRTQARQEWATTQNKLGTALGTLGEREAGPARLEEAIATFRAALEERTRERVPLDWAQTQNNLGNALLALGVREAGTARLEEAIATFRTALEERTRDRVPLDWATTQNNLGNALATLGEREAGTARLEEAVAAYRAALEEYTRERLPLDWAQTQNNLGNALATLGEREAGTTRLEEAITTFRTALEERTRDRVPLDWATTQNNLGNALATLGEREAGTTRLEEAITTFRTALEERTRDRVPLDWATTQNNLGNALATLGEREAGTARLEEAVAAFRAALEERTRVLGPNHPAIAKTLNKLAASCQALGRYAEAESFRQRAATIQKAVNDPLINIVTRRVMDRIDTTPEGLRVALERAFEKLHERD